MRPNKCARKKCTQRKCIRKKCARNKFGRKKNSWKKFPKKKFQTVLARRLNNVWTSLLLKSTLFMYGCIFSFEYWTSFVLHIFTFFTFSRNKFSRKKNSWNFFPNKQFSKNDFTKQKICRTKFPGKKIPKKICRKISEKAGPKGPTACSWGLQPSAGARKKRHFF